jgi:hypothetical protein
MQVKYNKVKQNNKQSKGCACKNSPRRSLLLPPRQRRQKKGLMRDGGVIFSSSSWKPQEEGMMNIAARFLPQLRNQGMSVKRGRSQTTEGDALLV